MGRFSFILLYLITTHKKGKRKPKKKKKADYFWALICPLKKDLRQGSPFLWAFIPFLTGPSSTTSRHSLRVFISPAWLPPTKVWRYNVERIYSRPIPTHEDKKWLRRPTVATDGAAAERQREGLGCDPELSSAELLNVLRVETDQVHSSKVKRISLAC